METIDENEEFLEKDDINKSNIFNDIAKKESSSISNETNKFNPSSFDNVPFLFNGLETSSFGMSSKNQKSPFFKIKAIAIDTSKSWDDRTQALRYMQRIPHIHRDINCIDAAKIIITDNQYPFERRFHFFSNNEKFIKLNYEIVNACHKYVYENFETISPTKIPLVYKILSAQYILTQFPLGSYDIDGVQNFLLGIAKDTNIEINYRAECADILDRTGYREYKKLGRDIIDELGDLYKENKKSTIYTNLQNVHDTTVTKKIIGVLRELMSTIVTERNTGEIYESIVSLTTNDDRRDIIVNSFQRILIDTARYEGLPMADIMLLVWEKISTSENKAELQNRLLDELYDMDKTCSSGHLSRVINVLSGFFSDIQPVNISFVDQIKANVFARYTTAMRSLSSTEQDSIIQEMTSTSKLVIEDFILSYSPHDELYEEFVPRYVTHDDFEELFIGAERDFFGINNEE